MENSEKEIQELTLQVQELTVELDTITNLKSQQDRAIDLQIKRIQEREDKVKSHEKEIKLLNDYISFLTSKTNIPPLEVLLRQYKHDLNLDFPCTYTKDEVEYYDKLVVVFNMHTSERTFNFNVDDFYLKLTQSIKSILKRMPKNHLVTMISPDNFNKKITGSYTYPINTKLEELAYLLIEDKFAINISQSHYSYTLEVKYF